jgi:hypothetical protein
MKIKVPRLISERLDFETHLKYATRLADLSNGLSATSNIKPMLNKDRIKDLEAKLQLIRLTIKSIKDEYKIVQFDSEYSTASVSWLPIKTYYLIYHLLCIIDYILTNDPASLSANHNQCIRAFSKRLSDQSIQFNKPLLNEVFDKSIFGFTSTSGEHLRKNVSDDVIFKLLMKKVARYKIKNYMITQSIPNLRQKKHKEKMNRFKNSFSLSIFDFFYLMRLRLNYRDFNFIDNIPASDTKVYFEEYYKAAENFYTCFDKLKDKLIADIITPVEAST